MAYTQVLAQQAGCRTTAWVNDAGARAGDSAFKIGSVACESDDAFEEVPQVRLGQIGTR